MLFCQYQSCTLLCTASDCLLLHVPRLVAINNHVLLPLTPILVYVIYVTTYTIESFKELTDFLVKHLQSTFNSKQTHKKSVATKECCEGTQLTAVNINQYLPETSCCIQYTQVIDIIQHPQSYFILCW